ncbi:MAG: amidohydrolase family protein [Spirochaetota bacterium]
MIRYQGSFPLAWTRTTGIAMVLVAALSLLSCQPPLGPGDGSPGAGSLDPVPLPDTGIGYVEAGSQYTLYWGAVLTPEGIAANAQVLIDPSGEIVYVGPDASSETGADGATRIVAGYGLAIPGLIDSLHYLRYADAAPAVLGESAGTDWDHRHEWREGLNGKLELQNPAVSDATASPRWGEARLVMHGVTSVVSGSGSVPGMARNLDDPADLGDLGLSVGVELETFPLGDPNGMLTNDPADYNLTNWSADGPDLALVAVVAEGTISEAQTEFQGINPGDGSGLLSTKSVIGPGLGLTTQDLRVVSNSGTALLWTPRSDLFLYGQIAPATTFRALGGEIVLGSRWSFTGSSSVLRELVAAREVNERYLNGSFTDRELVDMATSNAANALELGDRIGSIEAGRLADLVIVDTRGMSGAQAVFDASPARIGLVMRGGRPLYGDDNLVSALGEAADFEVVSVPNTPTDVEKWIAVPGEFGTTLDAIRQALGDPYPLAFADYATDGDEPPAVPRRTTLPDAPSSGDRDGDGVPDGSDNAPDHFNPPRPMDAPSEGEDAVQPDSDADGTGDVADPTPLGEASVPPVPVGLTASNGASQFRIDVDWNDSTGAGVYVVSRASASAGPYTEIGTSTNSSYTDRDVSPGETWHYTVRAAVDPASERSAASAVVAGSTRSEVSVSDIRTLGISGRVRLEGVIVTAVGSREFVVQDAIGGENSGIYVWTNSGFAAMPDVGDEITVDAYVGSFFDNLQLEAGSSEIDVLVESSGAVPDPTALSAAHTDWEPYEGVLVRLSGSTFTVGTPDSQGVATINVTNLEVDDTLYAYSSGSYTSVTGIVFDGPGGYQLLPRNASDMDAE